MKAWTVGQVDALHCSDRDTVIGKCLGMIALGALILLTAAHRTSH